MRQSWIIAQTFIVLFKKHLKCLNLERCLVSSRQSGALLDGQAVIIIIWQCENILAQIPSSLHKHCGGYEVEEPRSKTQMVLLLGIVTP